jgi:hypothetical protein
MQSRSYLIRSVRCTYDSIVLSARAVTWIPSHWISIAQVVSRLPAQIHIFGYNQVMAFLVDCRFRFSVRIIIAGGSLVHLSIWVEDTAIATRSSPGVHWLLELTRIHNFRVIILHAFSWSVLRLIIELDHGLLQHFFIMPVVLGMGVRQPRVFLLNGRDVWNYCLIYTSPIFNHHLILFVLQILLISSNQLFSLATVWHIYRTLRVGRPRWGRFAFISHQLTL